MGRRTMGVADVKEILVHWDYGEEISRIARTLGYSRPTVRKYLAAAEAAGLVRGSRQRDERTWDRLAQAAVAAVTPVHPVGAAAMDVARYHPYLDERVGDVQLSVLYQRLHDDHGLAASWGTFYRYARAHWPDRLQAAPRVTVRLDDPPPGNEAQIDFFAAGRWHDPEVGHQRRVCGFLMTLSHSRHQFLYPVTAEDSEAWLDGHVAAFGFFAGVPRRLVPDNLTAGVVDADRYDPRLNRAYGELARYYGCLVDPSRVRHPQDKPRVERNVAYARESFFRGQDFASLAAVRAAAVTWSREVAGQRVHGTTRERPILAFQAREQAALLPLPPQPWEPAVWTTAQVHADCHCQVAGAAYSVPDRYVGQVVDIRLGRRLVEVYAKNELLTTHARLPHGRSTNPAHYPAAAQAFLRATPAVCQARAAQIGSATAELVRTLLAPGTLTHLRSVQAILRLAETYDADRLDRACGRALDVGDHRYRTIQGILARGFDQLDPDPAPPPTMTGAFLRGPAGVLPPEEAN